MDFHKLHYEYKNLKMPYKYSINEIDNYLKKKYSAHPRDKKNFSDLKSDPFVNYKNIISCYSIEEDALEILLNSNEKLDRETIRNKILNDTSLSKKEKEQILKEENSINIIIESKDKKYISNFTIQGASEKIFNELIMLKGIDQKDCVLGNSTYEEYLRVLFNLGKI